jgi:hypothetical protein
MDTPEKVTRDVPRSTGKFLVFIGKEIIAQRKWVLFPFLVLLGALTLLLLLGDTSALLPAIYIAF